MRRLWPGLATVLTIAVAVFQLHAQGRAWLCSCGRVRIWVGDAWSADTSQHLLDPYSFTHLLHGVLFCWLLLLLVPKLPTMWQLWLTVTAEAVWEVVENTNLVIQRYREATAALGYEGDTVINSVGDILMCSLGFLLARRLGFLRSLVLFVVVEAFLLFWIRDSLLLNILMLIYPTDAIKAWQAGH